MRSLISTVSRWWTALSKRAGDVVDVFKPRGRVEFRLYHAHGPNKGELYKVIKGRNIVTSWLGTTPTSGRDMMRRILIPGPGSLVGSFTGQLSGNPNATIQQVQLGSGTTAEASSDTALETALNVPPYGHTIKALSSVTLDSSNPWVTFIFEYPEGEANATISEAGLYSGRGDFIARKTFGAFTKTNDFTLQVRWEIRF